MRFKTITLSTGLLALGTSLAAQAPAAAPEVKKTTQLHDVEIIDVHGNVITFEEGGVVKQWTAPEGYMFNVNGKPAPATSLEPGTKVSALVYTNTTTIPASKVVTIKSATVVKASGPNVIVKMQDGKNQSFMVKKGTKFMVNGKLVDVSELRPGMTLTQKIVTEVAPTTMTQQGMGTAATPPAPKHP